MEIIEREEKIQDGLVKHLKSNGYSEVDEFTKEEGAQKSCFTAVDKFGRKVFLTTDKKPATEAAQILADKGLNSQNEARVAGRLPIDEAILNGINPIMDTLVYEGQTVNVWPYFDGSMSLRNWVKSKGPFKHEEEFRSVFGTYFKAENYLLSKGLLHRDPNPGNLLLKQKPKSRELEARLVDMTSSSDKDDPNGSSITTGPARSVRDPLLDRVFSGSEKKHDKESELYGIAMNAIYSLIGYFPVNYDFIKGSATNSDGENLLNPDGTLNNEKHNESIDSALKRAPHWAEPHLEWVKSAAYIHKNIAMDKEEHPLARWNMWDISDIHQGYQDIEEALKGTLTERIKGAYRKMKTTTKLAIAGGLLGLAALTGLGVKQAYDDLQAKHQAQIKEASKLQVTTDWECRSLSMDNLLCNLELSAYVPGTNYQRANNSYPKDRFLKVNPGDDISLMVRSIQTAWRKKDNSSLDSMPIQIYFDGAPIEGKSFLRRSEITNTIKSSVYPESFNQAIDYDMGGPLGFDGSIRIPTNTPPGVYYLSALMFPPEENRTHATLEDIKFKSKKEAIGFKRIPVQVGKPSQAIDLNGIYIQGYSDRVNYKQLSNEEYGYGVTNGGKYTLAISIPEENYLDFKALGDYGSLWLPKGTNLEPRTLQLAVFNKDEGIINYTSVPIQREEIGKVEYAQPRAWEFWKKPIESKTNPVYWWHLGSFSDKFGEKTIENKKQLEGHIQNYFATNQPASSLTNGLEREYTIK